MLMVKQLKSQSTITGHDKKKLFNNINLTLYAPSNLKIIKVDKLWRDFMSINNRIKLKTITNEEI